MQVPTAWEHVSEVQNLPIMDIAKCDLSWGLIEALYVLHALVYRGLLKNISCQSLVLNCKCMAVYQYKRDCTDKAGCVPLARWQQVAVSLCREPSLKLRLATLDLFEITNWSCLLFKIQDCPCWVNWLRASVDLCRYRVFWLLRITDHSILQFGA